MKDGVIDVQKEGQFLVAKEGGGIGGEKLEELGLILTLPTRTHHLAQITQKATRYTMPNTK